MTELTQEEVAEAIDVLEKAQEKLQDQEHIESAIKLDHAKAILDVGWMTEQ